MLDWIGLFSGRISGALEYYYSKSVDLITERPVSLVNGISSLKVNDGKLRIVVSILIFQLKISKRKISSGELHFLSLSHEK